MLILEFTLVFFEGKKYTHGPEKKKKSKIILLTIQKATFYDIYISYVSVAIIDTRLI